MMRAFSISMVLIAGFLFPSCSKNNYTPVNGTINGLPAITLYGNSNRSADYLLLSKSQKEVFYEGTTFTYEYLPTALDIVIYISTTTVQQASLDTSAPTTILTMDANPLSIFGSSVYLSK